MLQKAKIKKKAEIRQEDKPYKPGLGNPSGGYSQAKQHEQNMKKSSLSITDLHRPARCLLLESQNKGGIRSHSLVSPLAILLEK